MVIETVFRTGDFPETDRFDLWRELMAKTMSPMEMATDQAEGFEAEMRLLQLGAVSVWPGMSQPMTFHRTPKLIRQSGPEICHLTLPLTGAIGISQDSGSAVHGPWDMYIVDTSAPFDCANRRMEVVGLEVPRRLLPLPEKKVGQLTTQRLSGRKGPGALLAGTLLQLARDVDSYGPSDGARLETVVVDLLAATLAHRLDEEDRLSPETRSRTLALRIQAFIRHHLHDPALTPSTIAAAHHISVSHLHRLFRVLGHGTTLAAWIRDQRLEQTCRSLADPAQRAIPISHVAARWGFSDAAVFSCVFRGAFGMSPRSYRHHALNGDGESVAGPPPLAGPTGKEQDHYDLRRVGRSVSS
ncbi:helix-turn-helix domain-containing protein [Streptomyces sp. NPDC102274]|uniref:AraC-like ligand-binding domain-containing protein n=1 Tax=Streptomyces sp. NPDC102274 TaxID=3366151 RepID=UPI0037FCC7BB